MPALLLFALANATPLATGAAVMATTPTPQRVQLGFYHFRGTKVRVTFEKRVILDKVIAAPPKGDRSGISDFQWVEISGCGTLTVTSGRAVATKRLCPREGTKSVKIDAGPPLTLTMMKAYQGND